MSCATSDLFSVWERVTTTYADKVLDLLRTPSLTFLSALLPLYWTVRLINVSANEQIRFADIGKEVFLVIFSLSILNSDTWTIFYDTVFSTATGLATFVARIGNGQAEPGLDGLLCAIHQPFEVLFQGTNEAITVTNFSLSNLGASLLRLIFQILIFAVEIVAWAAILLTVFTGHIYFIFVNAISPIIAITLALPPTRNTAAAAWRILINGIAIFLACGITAGLATHISEYAVGKLPANQQQGYLGSGEYFLLLIAIVLLLISHQRIVDQAVKLADGIYTRLNTDDAKPITNAISKGLDKGLNAIQSRLQNLNKRSS